MAGFPTKISESISFGVPVITTVTSDLEDYVFDNENGYFLDYEISDQTVNNFIEILENRKNLNIKSNPFFYKNYSSKLSHFFESI